MTAKIAALRRLHFPLTSQSPPISVSVLSSHISTPSLTRQLSARRLPLFVAAPATVASNPLRPLFRFCRGGSPPSRGDDRASTLHVSPLHVTADPTTTLGEVHHGDSLCFHSPTTASPVGPPPVTCPPRPLLPSVRLSSPVLLFDPHDPELILVSSDEEDDDGDGMEVEVDDPLSSSLPPRSGSVSPSSGSSSATVSDEEKAEGEGGGEGGGGGEASTQENRDLQEEDFHDSQQQMEEELHSHSANGGPPHLPTETTSHSPPPASHTEGGKRPHESVGNAGDTEDAKDAGDAGTSMPKRQKLEASTLSAAGGVESTAVMERPRTSAPTLRMSAHIGGIGVIDGVGVVAAPGPPPQSPFIGAPSASNDPTMRSPSMSFISSHSTPTSPLPPPSLPELTTSPAAATTTTTSPHHDTVDTLASSNPAAAPVSAPFPACTLVLVPASLVGTATAPTASITTSSSSSSSESSPSGVHRLLPSFLVTSTPAIPPTVPPRLCPPPLPRLLPSATFPLSRRPRTQITLSSTPYLTLLSLDPEPKPTSIGRPLTKKDLNTLCATQLAVRLEEIEEQVTALDEAMEKDGRAGVDVMKDYEARQDALQEEMDAIEEELQERKEKERKRRKSEREKWRRYNGPPPDGEEEEEGKDGEEDTDLDSDEDDSGMEVDMGEDSPSHRTGVGEAEEVKEPHIDAFALGASAPSAATYFDVVAEMSAIYQVNDAEFKRVTAEAARTVKFTSKGLFNIEQVEAGDLQQPSTHQRPSLSAEAAETKEGRADPPTNTEEVHQQQQPSSQLPSAVEEHKEAPAAPHVSIGQPVVAASAVPPLSSTTAPTTSPPFTRLPLRSTAAVLSATSGAAASPSVPAAVVVTTPPPLPPRPSPPRPAVAGGVAATGAPITSFFSPARRRIQPSLLSSFNASSTTSSSSSPSTSSSSTPSPSSHPLPPTVPHPPFVRTRLERSEPRSPPAGGDILFSVIDLTED